ncbi:MAG TPA: sigma 54-interacting transcriptional regulator [Kofleriaceae bacterium]|jgi:DNA-binding NtrC family response regulator
MSAETKLTIPDQDAARRGEARTSLVLYESDGTDSRTRVVELPDGEQFTIGRSRTASLRSESERVSRIHACFQRRGNDLYVEDAGSRNGTWVNGRQIAEPRRLASGDEVVVGPVTVVVNITTSAVTPARIQPPRVLDERLAAEVDRARRYRRPLTVVMLTIDGDTADTDEAWDRVAAQLRTMDLIVEYAPSMHAIVLPELDRGAAVDVSRALIAAAHATAAGIVTKLGIATYPEDATSADALISNARRAVQAASTDDDPLAALPPDTDLAAAAIVVDPQMRRVFELVRKVADHPITVLIQGETGVGKEVIACAIHSASARGGAPLVRLNCASLPEPLLESELFGHEKGAFTGADRRKQGYFEAANGGTLFLDEIGELSPAVQAKLLRVLENGRVTRVGGTDEIEVDVRVVCATHRDLERASQDGGFRSDLFFRISAFTILVPPLRDRADEIIPLARHFIAQAATSRNQPAPTLSLDAAAAIRRYTWPGNVRELRNAIERAAVLQSGPTIELEDLPDRVQEGRVLLGAPLAAAGAHDVRDQIADLERTSIVAALDACGGNQTEAARKLGLTRRTLIYRMEKHRLKPLPESRKPS